MMLLNCGAGKDLKVQTAKGSNQLILIKSTLNVHWKEGPMLKLKLQYFGHLMRKTH